eukprot:366212-Chlamydomonas_euryale.AAC.30
MERILTMSGLVNMWRHVHQLFDRRCIIQWPAASKIYDYRAADGRDDDTLPVPQLPKHSCHLLMPRRLLHTSLQVLRAPPALFMRKIRHAPRP